jgi:3-deoxy-D-manno-octulosonic-acid transferase
MRRYQVVRHGAFLHRESATLDAGAATCISLTLEDDVLVIDTLGHLCALTGCADAIFVGVSLIPHGGHNPLEAVARCVPIISELYTCNFASIYSDLFEADAAVEVDANTLSPALLD